MARFRFVPRADVFLRPFAQDSAEALKPFFVAARMYTLPSGLDEYLSKVVTGALERWVSEGAVGIDVGVAAWRGLDFDEVNAEAARSAYGRLVVGGEFGARAADLKAFQDYTFRHLAREAGRVGLVVHVKTGMSRDATGIVGNGNPNPPRADDRRSDALQDPMAPGARRLPVRQGDRPDAPAAQRLRRRERAGPGALAHRVGRVAPALVRARAGARLLRHRRCVGPERRRSSAGPS